MTHFLLSMTRQTTWLHLLICCILWAMPLCQVMATDAVVVDASGNSTFNGTATFVNKIVLTPTTPMPPTTGTFVIGTLGMDAAGNLWQCYAAGTPGLWRNSVSPGVTVIATNTAQSSITALTTDIPFPTETIDASNALNAGIFTAPVAGTYLVNAGVAITTAGIASTGVWKNGVQINWGTSSPSGIANCIRPVSCVLVLAAGDTCSIRSSISGALYNSAMNNYLNIVKVGP